MQVRKMKSAKTATCAILAAILAMMVLIAQGEMAYAARANENVPDLTKSKSTFTLNVNYTDDEETTPIDGVKLTVYKVAGVKVSGKQASYPVASPFKGLGFDFNNMTAGDSDTYAGKAAAVVASEDLKGASATTNGSGVASFGELENGIYLVMQTGATGSAKDYGKFSPWLVELPELQESASGSLSWNYNVTSYPKPFVGKYKEDTPQQTTKPEKETESDEPEPDEEFDGGDEEDDDKYRTPDEETSGGKTSRKKTYESNPFTRLVKTGDESSIAILAGIALIAAALLAVVVVRRRKRDQ